MLLGIKSLEHYAKDQRKTSKTCEQYHRHCVIVLQRICNSGVGRSKHSSDNHRECIQPDVLNPENYSVCGTEQPVVYELGNRRPQRCRNKRETDSKQDDSCVGEDGRFGYRQQESESQMTDDHEQCSENKHCGSFAFAVHEITEERGYCRSSEGEHEEYLSGLFGRDSEIALKHVVRIFLEWEDSRVVEDTKKCHNPEYFGRENIFQIGYLEWIVFFFSTCSHLCLKFMVHHCVDNE